MTRRLVPVVLAAGLGMAIVAPPLLADHVPVRNEDAKLLGSDVEAGDYFGETVAISGQTIVVGVTDDDEQGEESGTAYVFERDETGGWVETFKLLASDGGPGHWFGEKVAVAGDTIVVTTKRDSDQGEDAGAAYVFERDHAGVWVETAKLVGSDTDGGDLFGTAVGVDGDTIAVGAEFRDDLGFQSGAAYVFERDEAGDWVEVAKLLASDGEASDAFGDVLAIDGDNLVIGARGDDDQASEAGAAYVFERDQEGTWIEAAKLLASDGEASDIFGGFVAIDGDIVAVGATGESDQALVAGAAYVFERTVEGAWTETAKLFSPHPRLFDSFGRVGVSGSSIVVAASGGFGPGSADLFAREESGVWETRARLLASDGSDQDQFGIRAAIDGETVVVGARLDDDLGIDSGSAYVFSLEGCTLEIHLDRPAVRPGHELGIGLYLRHNRAETVTVPFRLWVEDPVGAVIASKTTPPTTFHHGDAFHQELTLRIPEGSPPGRYRVLVGIDRMQQGIAGAVAPFLVVE